MESGRRGELCKTRKKIVIDLKKPLNNKSKHNLYFYSIYECSISFVLLFPMYEKEPNCQIVGFKKQSDGTKNNNWSGINQLDRLKPQAKAKAREIVTK